VLGGDKKKSVWAGGEKKEMNQNAHGKTYDYIGGNQDCRGKGRKFGH